MNFNSTNTLPFTLIDLIKMFRTISTIGLGDAKLATERFLSVYLFTRTPEYHAFDFTKRQIEMFVKYAGMFTKGQLVVENGEIFPAVRNAVSDDYIMNLV